MRRELQRLSAFNRVASLILVDFSKNFFELFGLPPVFEVEIDRLAERYRALQQALHPDRFAAAGARERRLSMQASTQINAAYQTLKEPVARARYLLHLHTGEQANENETTKDMGFLMEQMELREALAGAQNQPDPYAAVSEVMDRLRELSGGLVHQLTERLSVPTADDLEAARELVRKLQFVQKCRVAAEQVEAGLDEAL